MLEVNKELWNATSYIYFEPLKIILRWQFESRKSAISTKVSISIYFFVINSYIPFRCPKFASYKKNKNRIFIKSLSNFNISVI